MEVLKIPKGKIIQKNKDSIRALYIILQGRVRVTTRNDSWDLEAGNILGLMESAAKIFTCNYITMEDTICYAFTYHESLDYRKIFEEDSKYLGIFTMAAMKQATFLIKRYKSYITSAKACYQFLMEMMEEYQNTSVFYDISDDVFEKMGSTKKLSLPDKIENWTLEYYEKLSGMPLKTLESFSGIDYGIAIGQILNASYWMDKSVSLNNEINDYLTIQKNSICGEKDYSLYNLFINLAKTAVQQQTDPTPMQESLIKILDFAKKYGLFDDAYLAPLYDICQNRKFSEDEVIIEDIIEQEEDGRYIIPEEKGNYLGQILKYAEYDEEKGEAFRKELDAYCNLPDLLSTEDEVRKIRRKLAEGFYDIYLLTFQHALEDKHIPKSIQMFLNFGLMEERLAGNDVADSLYELTNKIKCCNSENVFTMFEWLKSIYEGKNEPSRNEFDLDYQGHLLELRKTKKITPNIERELNNDTWKKVEYEIKNMFVSTNRATYGKISVFCPILTEHDIINSVENMLVTAKKINDSIDKIRNIDFSAFYREVVFSDPDKDVLREMIQKEVIPQVILLPNAGSKAMMWQENAGARKDTPARFVIPILTIADVDEMMIELVGRYRWEICRRIQGARWNDITERSLTSEYSDYIQYYRKNNSLSPEAKEKVKALLTKGKNNYREVFVMDYKNWIKYESKGSFRLNKVSRDIIFRYCPFVKEIRNELVINPMYRELFEKFEIFNDRKKKHVDIFNDRYMKKGGEITPELQIHKDFYEL